MGSKKLLLCTVLFFFIGLSFTSPVGAKMIKEVAIGVFSHAANQAETDRFYMRYHGPEITRLSGPWMTRYQLWLPYEPPEEAVELFDAVRGRYGELWYREEDHADLPAARGLTRPPFDYEGNPKKNKQTNVKVPCNPTEVFYDSDPHPEKTSILRWVTIMRYPEGVSVEDGEKWFLEVHAKEALKQPGLLKFVSHRVLESSADAPPPDMDMPEDVKMIPQRSWVRLCEYWYEDFDAWRKAILESPPKYTSPSWGGKYPFVEMTSTFIPYYNDVDFLKGTYEVNFDMPEVKYNTSP